VAHIVTEKEFSLQKGFKISEASPWDFGFNLRISETQNLQNQFLLIDALVDPEGVLSGDRIGLLDSA
jgi:hypothetical protein